MKSSTSSSSSPFFCPGSVCIPQNVVICNFTPSVLNLRSTRNFKKLYVYNEQLDSFDIAVILGFQQFFVMRVERANSRAVKVDVIWWEGFTNYFNATEPYKRKVKAAIARCARQLRNTYWRRIQCITSSF
jgi:hypothetical protein